MAMVAIMVMSVRDTAEPRLLEPAKFRRAPLFRRWTVVFSESVRPRGLRLAIAAAPKGARSLREDGLGHLRPLEADGR